MTIVYFITGQVSSHRERESAPENRPYEKAIERPGSAQRTTYHATASLYTNPATARLTTSKQMSEPSMLWKKRKKEKKEMVKKN